jgi:hypothetical protein
MPEKIPKDIWIILILIPFLSTLAQKLHSFKGCEQWRWGDFIAQIIVGTICGLLFGLLTCWLLGNNQAGVGAFSGFGAVLGIHSVERIALILENWLAKKLK